MIDKKQPVTKQFLLSFKTGHGDFYEKFVSILKGKVHYCRQVKQDSFCPNYMMAQKCMFMSILEKKNIKFKNSQFQLTQLIEILKKYREKILKSISIQKQCVLNKIKDFKIQQIQNAIIEVVTRENFPFNSFGISENTYIYQLFKAIFNKSQEVNFIGEQKYVQMSYSYIQTKQLSAIFGQNIVYFDYNTSKTPPTDINFNFQTTYILRVKDRYAILYVKQPKFIQIVKEGQINIEQLQDLFTKPQSKNQESFFSKFLGSKADNPQNNSKLFPDEIQCNKCSNKFSQFDCLKWNYEFCCGKCLQNPRLDTSSIPSTLIQKFYRQRGIKHNDYQIQCAECKAPTYLRRYNPAYKPQKYKCQTCEFTICIQHNCSIYECFCECLQCKTTTINILNLNLAVCEKCKRKYCRKCKKLSNQFCVCICKICFQLNQQGHNCRQKCHFCYNHVNKTKVCVCGNKICYGCYYYKFKNHMKNGVIVCSGPSLNN